MFKYDGKFGRIMTKIFDLIMLNAMFIVMCIPIITIGANVTALYAIFFQIIKKNESSVYKLYFNNFKENFKQATMMWLILLTVVLVLLMDLFIIGQLKGVWRIVIFSTYSFLAISIIYCLFMFPMISKFKNSLWEQAKNIFLVIISYLPRVVVLLLVNFGPIFVVFKWFPNIYGLFIYFYLFIGSSLTLYLNSIIFNAIFMNLIEVKKRSLLEA